MEQDRHDPDPSADTTIAPLLAPVQIQDGSHVGDTAAGIAPASTAPCPDTAVVEDQECPYGFGTATAPALVSNAPEAASASIPPAISAALVEAPALVVDLDPVAPAPLLVEAPTPAPSAGDPAICPPAISAPAPLLVEAPTPAPSAGDPAICPPAISAPALVPDGPEAGDTARPIALVAHALPPPDLKHIIGDDLRDMARLDPLYQQAIDAGFIRHNPADRLKFVSAAVHARQEGDNPPAMFHTLVTKRLWAHATAEQEDTAHAMMKKHDWGAPPALRMVPKPTPPPALSEDARTVAIVRQWLLAERDRGDPFHRFKQCFDEARDWTRVRWETASRELDSREVHRDGR